MEKIDARQLKQILLGKSNFSRWIKENIKKFNLKENEDYIIKEENRRTTNKLKIIKRNYYLTTSASRKIIYSQTRSTKTEKIRNRLEKGETLEKIIIELLNETTEKVSLIKLEDKEYPKQLKNIKNPPKQLYVMGDIQNLHEYGVAVVGTRKCSNYGRKMCRIFTNNLVGFNLNIISGLAIGIDSCAHRSCIEAKGKTIVVLPCGFNNIFPKENQELLNEILKNGGTVVTEYPADFEKTSESCKERNRIVSGLAIATLVVEAERRSGTSITVRHTSEQNKKAFCIPSSLLNSKGVGTNEMIKENKAKIVTTVEDIIEEFPELKLERKVDFNFLEVIDKKKSKQNNIKSKIDLEISEENLELYNILSKGPKTIDEIAEELNEQIQEITYKLTLLELQGAIEQLPGKKFKIK